MQTENHYTETDLGNVSPNPRGEYVQGTEYEYLDLVTLGGGSYLCLTPLGTMTTEAPQEGKTTDLWQCIALPGSLTPEYIAMHDDVVNKYQSAAEDREAIEQAREDVSGMQENVAQLQTQAAQDAQEVKGHKDSAAGYSAAAEAARQAAEEAEANTTAQVTGFDTHVNEKTQEARESIAQARGAAINAVTTQQTASIQAAKESVKEFAIQKQNEAQQAAADEIKKINAAGTTQVSTVNQEGTTQVQNVQNAAANIIDIYYRGYVNAASSVEEVNSLFASWWNDNWSEGVTTRNELLARWFGNVLEDDRVHGVKIPLFATSTSAICELTDDSAGLTCKPSTKTTPGQDDFAYLPQFWCVEVSAEKNNDGTHTIYAVEHIDDIKTVRSGDHLCWVLQKNTYTREWEDDKYRYFKMRCRKAAGYEQWPQGKDVNGTVYPYMANPKYYAGLKNGTITCGTGLAPVNYTSHIAGVKLWRERGAQYSGASGNLLKFQLAMIWLKYGVKGNSGTIEGCSSYSYQYTAAVTETGVERIILTTVQAANLLEGSNVIIGNKGSGTSVDRGAASMYSICKNKRIKSIESVIISEVEYAAVNIDNDGTTFDTVAGETYISTMPCYSGWNDDVQGFDGSCISPTSGKEPGLIQKTEFQNGAYLIISDELWQWGTNASGDYTFDCYTCHTQSKVSGSAITSDYEKQEDLTLVFPAGTTAAWWYIEDISVAENKAVLWPKAVSAKAGSGTGAKAGFYVAPASSGVRAAWCVCLLYGGGITGLPARDSIIGVSSSGWYGALGAPGLAG